MKELEIIIQPYKIENLKRILDSEGATGVMITQIFGYGREKGSRISTIQEMSMSALI